MPRNGSGTQTRLYNWVSDKANSIAVTASRMDAEMDDMTTSLSNSIAKDGQTTITANIPFNSNKITGLTNGSDRTDSIALGQVQDGAYTTLGTAGGAANAYTASPSPLITAYATGSRYIIKIQADNTGASTLNISGVGAKNIKKYDGAGVKVDVEAGDLQQDQYYDIFYDGTDIVVLNPQAPYINGTNFTNLVAASTTASGVIELATQAEVNAGTDTTRAVVPSTLQAHPAVAKVWVNFNGTSTVVISDSYNVTSITDNGVGDYTINFTTPFAGNNYAVAGAIRGANFGASYTEQMQFQNNLSTGSVRVFCNTVTPSSAGVFDPVFVSLICFGTQ